MQQANATAFDEMARDYDASFTSTALGLELRATTWARMEAVFAGRGRVLEIGCGTGEDAIHLARQGCQVLATDASAQMLSIAAHKAARAGCAAKIRFLHAPMERLGAALAGDTFDGVWSNFGAVNCVPDAGALAAQLAPRLTPGAPLLWVLMGRYVPWEWVWYLARGDARKAFRRLRGEGVEWRGLRIGYPTPDDLARTLLPHFEERRRAALGCALPPSYAAAWLERSPRAFRQLARLEHALRGFRASASLADHYIFEAIKVPGHGRS